MAKDMVLIESEALKILFLIAILGQIEVMYVLCIASVQGFDFHN